MRLGLVGRRWLLVVGSVLAVTGVVRCAPSLGSSVPPQLVAPPAIGTDERSVVAGAVVRQPDMSHTVLPDPPPAPPGTATAEPPPVTNALGLASRGEFVVDPTAAVAVAPGQFSPVPEDPLGRYRFGMTPQGGGAFTPVLPENRCLRPELASVVQNLGLRFDALFGGDGLALVVGEGNSSGNHVTHYGGAFVDLYTSLANARTERFVERDGGPHPYVAGLPAVRNYLQFGGELTYEQSIGLWLVMAIVDSGQFSRVVFEDDKVNALAEAYAAAQGVAFAADSIRGVGNRTHFFHLHLESTPMGDSRSCALT